MAAIVYENIRRLATEKNISITNLEKASELGNGTIGKWNSNSCSPSLKSLERIAECLKVDVTELLKKEE